jgi:ATP-binding cassette, subfamily C (CFTR/MRP), member 1
MLISIAFNGSISAFITGWTILETSLGAISRLKELEEDVTSEPTPENPQQLPQFWPSFGHIEIKGLDAYYS